MSRNILVRFWHFPVVTLGPGKRLGIWFQGCSIHCKGCIAPENQPFDETFSMNLKDFIDEISHVLSGADGVTISGGEPLDQKEALVSLLTEINSLGKSDILLYSGYSKGTALEILPELAHMVAALISEPFVEGDITSAVWKGSENQKITVFRKQYSKRYEDWCSSTVRNMQIIRKNTSSYLLGIPKQGDLSMLRM